MAAIFEQNLLSSPFCLHEKEELSRRKGNIIRVMVKHATCCFVFLLTVLALVAVINCPLLLTLKDPEELH